MKKLAAALFLSTGLFVAAAPTALAEPPAAACNKGTEKAHGTVPHLTAGHDVAHSRIPHCGSH